jgi:disulfide bond formation protein DsbB
VTHDVVVVLCALGVVGIVVAAALVIAWLLSVAGVEGPLRFVRELVWGYELWLVFAVALLGTAGSLFLSEVAHFPPCELCWYQRISLYPLTILSLMAALRNDYRIGWYMLPFPVVGIGLAVYQVLLENGVLKEPQACLVSAPGGCATKWVEEFGFMTIPVLGLTGFVLATAFVLLAATGQADPATEELSER